MAEPENRNRTLWLLVIGLLAVAALIFILNPTRGEDEARMEAVAEKASIDRDDTLRDYPVEAESYSEEGDVALDVPEGEETGALAEQQLAEPAE